MTVSILSIGLTTPVGLCAATTASALRAGIARIREHAFSPLDEPAAPLAWLDEACLPAPGPWCAGLDGRRTRLVRLAGLAIAEALSGVTKPVPLLLALPDGTDPTDERDDRRFLAALARQADVTLALPRSAALRHGRAGGLLALAQAVARIERGDAEFVCVGGVDSHLDSDLLVRLAAEGRLHDEGCRDGLVPGEAAAFVMLGRARPPGVGVVASAQACATPLREGLALTLQALFGEAETAPIRQVYAGATGEQRWGREWSVAHLRHAERFVPEVRLDHPAEFIGDPGAALGPLLVGLAAISITRGYRRDPCLVWCGSDGDERAAALLKRTSKGVP